MAEEAVERDGEEQNREMENENQSTSLSNDMSIIVNTSAINENKTSDEFKYGFSSGDLYKLGLEFYKKGKTKSPF